MKQITVKEFAEKFGMVDGKGDLNVVMANSIMGMLTQKGIAKIVGQRAPVSTVEGVAPRGKSANVFEVPDNVVIDFEHGVVQFLVANEG